MKAVRRAVAALAALLPAGGGAAGPIEIPTVDGPTAVVTLRAAERPGAALLVGLHGFAMDERQMATLANVSPEADHAYVSVRGFDALEGGGRSWFPIALDGDAVRVDASAAQRAVDRLARLVPALVAHHRADPDRVYLIGYSQGGTLALAAALLRPDAAAGFAGFAGFLPDEVLARADRTADGDARAGDASTRPVLIGHGSLDPLISREDIDRARDRLEATGREVELHVSRAPHVIDAAGRAALTAWLERHLRRAAPDGPRPDTPTTHPQQRPNR